MTMVIIVLSNFASAFNDKHSSLTVLHVEAVMLGVNRLHPVDEECGTLLCNCHSCN